ncbi:hypothetical protein CKJ90_30355, partial [Klebsiella pneumoniae]
MVFWSFRLMAGLGMLMLLLGVLACGCVAGDRLYHRGRSAFACGWASAPTPLLLFGWPDMDQERTRYGLEIPALGSLILTH